MLVVAALGGVIGLGVFGSDWLADRRAESLRSERKRLAREARQAEAARTGISDWVSLPGGSYEMGSASGDADEQPVHTVQVPAFSVMKTEVTVSQYGRCVDAGSCTAPDTGGYKDACNWGKPDRGDHPVNCVDWDQAVAFASWAGGRLPTESEWEYAARSGGRSQAYPWGDAAATCDRAVLNDGGLGCGLEHTAPVCSKPAGNSSQGVCDLAGNVWEWVQDGWHDTYTGAPGDGTAWEEGASDRVRRGGGWSNTASRLRASYRYRYGPSNRDIYLGFRLARSNP